jgi:hypothetical protein
MSEREYKFIMEKLSSINGFIVAQQKEWGEILSGLVPYFTHGHSKSGIIILYKER